MTDIPHFAFPFRLGPRGDFAMVEQDGIDEVSQNVGMILLTRRGTRIEIPEFGTDTLLFTTPGSSDLAEVVGQVGEWEPRVTVLADDTPELLDDMVRQVRVVNGLSGDE